MSHLQALPVGTELVGDFRVERVLGAGGFGITYLAEEPALARMVTIKEYFPADFAHRSEGNEAVPHSRNSEEDYKWGLDRFIDEAQTLAKFDHPNIVRVHRYFRANSTGYMVLQFEEGQSLKSWLRTLGRSPRQNELDRILAPLLEALSVIHDADFLHRDIAPDNIIIRKDGSPVLIDFGSARGEIAKHTRTISALVKPGYSPYEQYAETGRQQGPWTDIYALAATLYHAVTGKRPPDAPSRIVKDEMRPTREVAISAYRKGFLKAIDRGLELDIDKRPQSIAAWRGDLLAPEASEQKGWFGRASGSAKPSPEDDDGPVKTTPVTAPPLNAGPPPPDAPGPKGKLADYIDGLKKPAAGPAAPSVEGSIEADAAQNAAAAAVKEAPAAKEAVAGPEAARAQPVRKSGIAGLFGLDGSKPNAGRKPAETEAPAAEPAAPQKAKPASAAAKQGVLMPVPSTPLKPAARRKPPRPKPIRSNRRSWWRPLAFKLLIGIGIASLAVAYQQRLPKLELRSLGMVSSSSRTVEKAASERTASVRPSDESTPRKPRPAPSLFVGHFKAHMPGTTFARYANDAGWIATTGADSTLRIWQTDTQAKVRTIELDDGPATALAISGKLALTGHSEGTVALWDLTTGAKLAAFKHSDVRIWSVAFDGSRRRIFAASHDWSVAVWEANTPSAPLHVFKGHENAVQTIAYSAATNELATGGADKRVRLWSLASLSRERTYRRERDFVTALRFTSDGDRIAAGLLNGDVRLLSAGSRRRIRSFRGHDDAVLRLQFLKGDQHLLSFSKDGTAKLWRIDRSRPVRTYGSVGTALTDGDLSVALGRMITADANGTVKIWRIGGIATRPRGRRR